MEFTNSTTHQTRLNEVKDASKATETKRAIEKHWRKFLKWGALKGLKTFPSSSETLEKYLFFLKDENCKISTIEQAKWAINSKHKIHHLPEPANSENIRVIIKGLRRILGGKKNKKQALTIEHIASILFPDSLIGLRDKALLLIGFAGGLRRTELSNLDCNDLEWENFGLRLYLKKSKTNQEGREEFINIMAAENELCCPVKVLKRWLVSSKTLQGALFRSINKAGVPQNRISTVTIGKKVKWAAKQCGFDSRNFGGHSLRAGCATYLLKKKVALNIVSKHLRHKRLDTTLQYDRNTTAETLKGVY